MTKTVPKEIRICDVCGQEAIYAPPCDACGKDLCYECREKHAVEYPHAVGHSGSGDGLYCLECDRKLRNCGDDPRHSAFLKIQALRLEETAFYEDFKARCTVAEEEVRRNAKPRP